MRVCVSGLWHLGTVTAACLASAGHDVIGHDADQAVVDRLSQGIPPLFEPGLEVLVKNGLESGRLRFSADTASAASGADVLWIALDTPVDDEDRADVEAVVRAASAFFPYAGAGTLIIVSSQVPVGTTRRLEQSSGSARFAYLPENLRLGNAIETFTRPDRIVAGTRSEADRAVVEKLLQPFTTRFEWMSVESAEMTKHALNAFLATSITFINEIAALCEQTGADASEVARGLKSDARIGPRAYLSPGGPFAGGTLARDIAFLATLGQMTEVPTPLVSAVKTSNDAHRRWAARRLAQLAGPLAGRAIAVWGLTYKPGTDTLRRSTSIELCEWLVSQGARVSAHDPAVRALPADLAQRVRLADDPVTAIEHAAAVVIATPWPEYRSVDAAEVARRMPDGIVLDAGGFLADTLGRQPDLKYVRVGQPVK